MCKEPLGQLQIVFVDADAQQITGATAEASHVEHRPVGILPIGLSVQLRRLGVDQLQEPEEITVEMQVVKHLGVVRLRAALQ